MAARTSLGASSRQTYCAATDATGSPLWVQSGRRKSRPRRGVGLVCLESDHPFAGRLSFARWGDSA
jgi:hypothetical protein